MMPKAGLEPRVMVDCSHAQTNKDYTKQPEVFAALIEQVHGGSHAILGAMLESNLEAGSQPLGRSRGPEVWRLDHRPLHRLGDHRALPDRCSRRARLAPLAFK